MKRGVGRNQTGVGCSQAMKIRQSSVNLCDGWAEPLFSTSPEERIHDIRVAIKKLRAFLRLMRPEVCRETFLQQDQLLKRAAGQLAGFRDAAVIRQTLKKALRKCDRTTQTCLAPWIDSMQYGWPAANGKWNPSPDVDGEIAAIQAIERFAIWGTEIGQRVAADPILLSCGLKWTYTKARRKWRRALKSHDASDFHECRMWIKWLYLQIQGLRARLPDSVAAFVQPLERLQEDLGKHHDTHLALKFIKGGSLPSAAGKHLRRLRSELERRGRKIELRTAKREGLFALDPGTFVRGLVPAHS